MVVVCVVVEGVGGVICFLNFTDPGLSYKLSYQGPISQTDLNLFWGLNVTQSDSWLSLSLFVKLAPEVKAIPTMSLQLFQWESKCPYIQLFACSNFLTITWM